MLSWGIRDKPRPPLQLNREYTQYLEWPGGFLCLREQIKGIYQQSVFEEREFSMEGEIGAWLLQIGREIPCGTKAPLQDVEKAKN